MKRILLLACIFFLLSFRAEEDVYVADKNACTVHWTGKKTTGQHQGDLKLLSGKMNFSNGVPVSGEFVLDMTSIIVTDIKDAEDNKDLCRHLKGDDFFGVTKFPTASLAIKKFEKIAGAKQEEPDYNVTADLAIKGIKNEIQFPARIDISGEKVIATADIIIDRTKWNIVYSSKSVFSTLGDKFIYDDVDFSVTLLLDKQM